MARIISIVNQKGGVGKTTTSINLAASLALLGQRVLLIDMDAQGNASSGLGVEIPNNAPSMYDVLIGEAMLQEILVETAVPGLHLAPATVDLAGATVELVEAGQREYRLSQAIEPIKPHYDFVLIDCPPSLGILTINGIVGSEEVLIPVQAEYYALEGLSQLLRTVQLVQQHLQPGLGILGAVITMYDRRNRLAQSVYRDLYAHFPEKFFRTTIPRAVKLAEAPSYGKPIALYAKTSIGARAYKRLAKEILGAQPETLEQQDEPLPDQAVPQPPIDTISGSTTTPEHFDSPLTDQTYG
jgi:chromosome partitioning protein